MAPAPNTRVAPTRKSTNRDEAFGVSAEVEAGRRNEVLTIRAMPKAPWTGLRERLEDKLTAVLVNLGGGCAVLRASRPRGSSLTTPGRVLSRIIAGEHVVTDQVFYRA